MSVQNICSTSNRRRIPKVENFITSELPFYIYMTNKSDYQCHWERIEMLRDNDAPKMVVNAVGSAIRRAVKLSLDFYKQYHWLYEIDIIERTQITKFSDTDSSSEEEETSDPELKPGHSICVTFTRRTPEEENVARV